MSGIESFRNWIYIHKVEELGGWNITQQFTRGEYYRNKELLSQVWPQTMISDTKQQVSTLYITPINFSVLKTFIIKP